MRSAAFALASILFCSSAVAQYCYPLSGSYIETMADAPIVTSFALSASAQVFFEGCNSLGFESADNYSLTGLHRITSNSFQITASEPVAKAGYGGTLTWGSTLYSSGTPGACYTNYVDAREVITGVSQGAGSAQTCLPRDPCASALDRRATVLCDQDSFTNWSDPIVIALDDASYHLTSWSSGVRFDLDVDGVAETTAWTRAGDAVAFLALDRNGDGIINDGSELFGNRMSKAKNGFLALAELDANNDGVVDRNDGAWAKLLLWIDENHNGVSEALELRPVAASSIASIRTTYHYTGRADAAGNLYLNAGHASFASGERPIYDVWLTRLNPSTQQ